jgi:hypothetical protein
MSRAPRGPKRSPTPTSVTTPTSESSPSLPAPPSPGDSGPQKPLYLCSPFVEAALVKGNFKTIVMLPKYVDIMEWVAVNSMYIFSYSHTPIYRLEYPLAVFDFYTNLNEFYGVITECCTQQSCPTMSAGPSYVLFCLPSHHSLMISSPQRLNYTWINQDRKSVNLPAPTYIDYVMTWVQNLLDDETVFPTKSGAGSLVQIDPECSTRPLKSHPDRPGILTIVPIHGQTCIPPALACLCTYLSRALHSTSASSL